MERWKGEGAVVVALVGSYARGTAGLGSDIDVAIVGEGPRYRLEVHDRALVSASWASEETQRARLYDPVFLTTHVLGWREAVLLHDPSGVGESIAAEARAWTWDRVSDRSDAWAAASITDFAEELLKLLAALVRGEEVLAAVQRNLLALHLARPVALRRRLLVASENELWEQVARALGREWQVAQRAAFAVDAEDVRESSRAALELYGLAVDEVSDLLDERQRAVVERARSAAEPISGSS